MGRFLGGRNNNDVFRGCGKMKKKTMQNENRIGDGAASATQF